MFSTKALMPRPEKRDHHHWSDFINLLMASDHDFLELSRNKKRLTHLDHHLWHSGCPKNHQKLIFPNENEPDFVE